MVLLTSSAVSAIISAGVVCTFTFLLFLSGYVLQQQTVRSLQEALRAPPVPKPKPTLPAAFQNLGNITEVAFPGQVEQVVVSSSKNAEGEGAGTQDVLVQVEVPKAVIQGEEERQPASDIPQGTDHDTLLTVSADAEQSTSRKSLGYIFSLSEASELCSAVLFAKLQRQYTHFHTHPSIMMLYPTTWETSGEPLHISALTFMRDMQDEYALRYHPVNINTVWSGVSLNAHLLGEMQRIRWDFDRALYLKSPGLATDIGALDRALANSNIKSSWAQLSASAGEDPEMLFYTRQKGLMMARGEMRRLTATALTIHADHHANGIKIEASAKNAAYVLFDEEELEHRRNEKEWYGGVFEEFERERRDICKGRGLLPGEEDKLDLRRKT